AVVNIDDPWGRRLEDRTAAEVQWVPYGTAEGADVRAEELVLAPEGSRFRVSTPWGHARVRSRLLGRYNVSNMLAAIASAGVLGFELESIAGAFATMSAVPGRLEEIPTDKEFQVFVDYAHTDDALAHVLRTLREIAPGRLLAVFGCGGNRDPSKRPAMGAVAAELADFTILTSDNPRKEDPWQIIQEIKSGFGDRTNYEIIEDRSGAINRALQIASKGDVVLIAGKGHETFQEFANTTLSFDDRLVVRKALNGKSRE
ncbi:MAG: UDP-N-acetylmuramyl-tripeptide synthetase, partial [Lentisphaerae bacterium]|nr:UDP-N-acetylmuramyl-tripeptide synthetase [Lentisphaerota bacterium]